jgi:hypothetical protein
MVLPNLRRQHRGVLLSVLEVFFIGDMCAKVATTNVWIFLIDTFTSVTPDAGPSTG